MPHGYATIRSLPEAMSVIKEMNLNGLDWNSDYRSFGLQAVKAVLEGRMRENIDKYLDDLSETDRTDRRNGTYRRHLLTELGDVELAVPRTRRHSALGVVRAYRRRSREIDRMILSCFVLGISTRKVSEALLPVLGERVSSATVSRLAKRLDKVVEAFHRRSLKDQYRVLVLDGVVLTRKTGAGASRRPVLVALGVRPDGKKEIIDFRLALGENVGAWEAFLNNLFQRGLSGDNLEIIVTDGGTGLLSALPLAYPHTPLQRCWAHKVRNILDKAGKKDQPRIKIHLHRIMNAPNITTARKAAREFADQWRSLFPKAVKCLLDDLDDLLTFFKFKDQTWRKMARTTNAIERRFREVRRRTRPMGVFSDKTSIERILFAVFSYENKQQGISSPFLMTQNS